MSADLEYNDICLLVRGCLNGGKLKLHKSGVVFKNNKTGKVEQLNSSDIASVKWIKVARGYEMKFILSSGVQFKFEGFKESEFDKLSNFISSNFNAEMEEVELSVKGWNWGNAQFNDSVLTFEVGQKPAFEIPLKDVSAATTGKNEVTLEFHQHDDAEVSLMEMRFYVPPNNDGTDADPVKTFHEKVLAKADVIQATGDAIVTFEEVTVITPRGKYTAKIYPSFLQLHGKTYDYKIPYTTILRVFLLPHRDNRFMFFVISTDPPIKQGQTRYPFIIFRFDKDEEVEVRLNLTEDEISEKYNSKLSGEMTGPIFEVMSKLMKAVTGCKITVPGSFKSGKFCSIACSYKAGSGFLYPLERGFMFVTKPPVHIRFDEIAYVNFARVQSGGGTSSRSFDFEVEHKNGSVITFSSIDKEEYSKLFDFVSGKKLKIKNKGIKKKVAASDDFAGSDEETHDAYLEQMKAEGAEKDEDDSDSEDESDVSFNPAEEDEQEVREEFASDVSSSESGESDDSEKQRKKEKEKPKKKQKKEKTPKKEKPQKEKEVKEGKSRKRSKKDPNAPKKALSAYMLWLNETRESIKKDNPGISVTELSKKAGVMWKALEDKSKWDGLAAKAKLKYEEQMKEYKKNQLSGEGSSKPSQSPKKASKKSSSLSKSSPKKAEEPGKYKSAEFVESDGSSSSSEEKKPKKEKRKKKKESSPKSTPSKKAKKEESEDEESEEEMESDEISDESD